MMRKVLPIVCIAIILAVPFLKMDILPVIGDPDAPAHTHTSDYYIENATTETNAPNMVTAVIVDYRAYDTMFETTVMFLAGLGVVLVLANKPEARNRIAPRKKTRRGKAHMGEPAYQTINKEVMIPLIEPLILIYGIYVLFHGEVSLGGGFQAGALFGMVYILDVMVIPEHRNLINLPKERSLAIGGVGTFIYALTGILCFFGGGYFLEYAKLPIEMHELEKHSTGMLLVEIGVALCVMATIITILNAILERARFDDEDRKGEVRQ